MSEPAVRLAAVPAPNGSPPPADPMSRLRDRPEAVGLEPLLTPPEAAKLLKVSDSWLWQNTAPRGAGVPCLKLGRSVRYAPADLAAFVDRLRAEGGRSLRGKGGGP